MHWPMLMNAWSCTCTHTLRPVGAAPHQARAAQCQPHRQPPAPDRDLLRHSGQGRQKYRPRRDHRAGGTDWWWKGRRGRWMGTDGRRKDAYFTLNSRIDRFCEDYKVERGMSSN
ncbi:hypothetical protein EDB89DRAFT_2033137 [Lactarius sanguifluus]|nr:hypothetical protein EDB89DRAFT_2033137 [Lactarius sanguifluus]